MRIKKIVSWLLFISWLGIIFFFSSQNGAASSNLSNTFLMLLPFKISPIIIRKLAHFTEYFILGILGMNIINLYNRLNKRNILYLVMFIFLYATSDEIHQYFVGGRAMRALDVLIDFTGGLVSVLSYYFINKYIKTKI